jgi:hypothetical protein
MEKKETLSEEVREFNPDAFAGLDKLVDSLPNDSENEDGGSKLLDEASGFSEEEIPSDIKEEEEDDSDFDWLADEEEDTTEEEETKEEPTDDWDSITDSVEADSEEEQEGEVKANDVDWDSIAKELGMEGFSKDEIVEALKKKPEASVKNEATSKYEGFLKLDDRQLLAADMKATGMDEYDVDDSLDRMEDSGMLKHEALKIRKQLRSAIKAETTKVRGEAEAETANKVKGQDDARKALQDHLKGFNNYLGGKVTVEQRKDLYKYITNGNFNEDVYKSHANVAEAAFLWKNRGQIQKMLKSQGFEDGKGSVLDNLTNRGGRGTSKPKYRTGDGFSAAAFMDE